ncbi:MAG: LptA/OstA family protein [Magnetococcus sp. MYC-9]
MLWGLLFLLGAQPGGAPSVCLAATATDATGGLTITSERMELDDKKQVAVFAGDVRAEEKRMRLTADKMTVNYRKGDRPARLSPPGNRGGVAKILAEGHVVLVQGENHGTAEEMIYTVDKQTLEMLGHRENAAIYYGNDRLEGKRILLTIGDDHAISKIAVQGGEQRRVSARITPPEEGDGKSEPLRVLPRPNPKPPKSVAKPVDAP